MWIQPNKATTDFFPYRSMVVLQIEQKLKKQFKDWLPNN